MGLIRNGRIALHCFAIGFSLFLSALFFQSISSLAHYVVHYVIFYAMFANILAYVIYRDYYDVAIRALSLGLVLSLSLFLALSSSSVRLLGWYICALCIFHWGEYFVTAVTNPRNLSLESFLLDHSREYHIAIAISVIEFLIEWCIFPRLKQPGWISIIGLCVVLGGEMLRKLAMLTAKTNFNHYVQYTKQKDHELVTNGIYSITRHPSYVGWFYWSIGNQVMLGNPVCAVAFAIVSWKFFQERIVTEEIALINFFGEDYLAYQRRVGTGIPLLKGYRIEI